MVDVSEMIVYQHIFYFPYRPVVTFQYRRNALFLYDHCSEIKGKGCSGIIFPAQMFIEGALYRAEKIAHYMVIDLILNRISVHSQHDKIYVAGNTSRLLYKTR